MPLLFGVPLMNSSRPSWVRPASWWTPALRVGYWFDPAHAVTYQALGVPDATDQRFEAYLPKATSLSHVTFGGGIAVSRHLEINGAADWSSRRAFYSLLAIGRF